MYRQRIEVATIQQAEVALRQIRRKVATIARVVQAVQQVRIVVITPRRRTKTQPLARIVVLAQHRAVARIVAQAAVQAAVTHHHVDNKSCSS